MSTVRPIAPDAVRWIARTLEDAGFETWAVGGAVRDALLGHATVDWDLATRATPKQMRRVFRRTVPIGIEHGTVGVLADDGVMYEVTTFRRDVETDGRHAVVAFADRVDEDLARRDFTINAIAWHPLEDVVLDPFGGAGDLRSGVLRTVGVPEERFREDYLRILRALRFAGRFGLEIEDGTWAALTGLVDHLPGLSPERVREELLKILASDPAPGRALGLYRSSGATSVLYPELNALPDDRWTSTLRVVEGLPVGRPLVRLAALVRSLTPADAAALLVRLRLSNAATDDVARWAAAEPFPPAQADGEARRRWLARHGVAVMRGTALIQLSAARAGQGPEPRTVVEGWRALRSELRSGPPVRVGDLAVDGRDLKRLGLRPGPIFGEILEELLDWVLGDPSRNRAELLLERAGRIAERRTTGAVEGADGADAGEGAEGAEAGEDRRKGADGAEATEDAQEGANHG